MEKLAIHLKYINSRVTSFFGILGKANHRPYCADEVILTESDDLVQPTIGWSSYTKKDAVLQWLSNGKISSPPKSVFCWRSQNWHYQIMHIIYIYIFKTHAYCDYTKKHWLLFENILKNLYAHNILFRKAKININNYGLFVVRYFYVL